LLVVIVTYDCLLSSSIPMGIIIIEELLLLLLLCHWEHETLSSAGLVVVEVKVTDAKDGSGSPWPLGSRLGRPPPS